MLLSSRKMGLMSMLVDWVGKLDLQTMQRSILFLFFSSIPFLFLLFPFLLFLFFSSLFFSFFSIATISLMNSSLPRKNCYVERIRVLGDLHIGVYARQDLKAGTEIFFDYGKNFSFKTKFK
jgi:hypothetical protein